MSYCNDLPFCALQHTHSRTVQPSTWNILPALPEGAGPFHNSCSLFFPSCSLLGTLCLTDCSSCWPRFCFSSPFNHFPQNLLQHTQWDLLFWSENYANLVGANSPNFSTSSALPAVLCACFTCLSNLRQQPKTLLFLAISAKTCWQGSLFFMLCSGGGPHRIIAVVCIFSSQVANEQNFRGCQCFLNQFLGFGKVFTSPCAKAL